MHLPEYVVWHPPEYTLTALWLEVLNDPLCQQHLATANLPPVAEFLTRCFFGEVIPLACSYRGDLFAFHWLRNINRAEHSGFKLGRVAEAFRGREWHDHRQKVADVIYDAYTQCGIPNIFSAVRSTNPAGIRWALANGERFAGVIAAARDGVDSHIFCRPWTPENRRAAINQAAAVISDEPTTAHRLTYSPKQEAAVSTVGSDSDEPSSYAGGANKGIHSADTGR